MAWEAERAAAASKAREVVVAAAAAVAAVVEAAAAAEAEVDALERATADGGEGGCSGAAGPRSEASEVAVPDQYVCPITAEIMTDSVSTVRLSLHQTTLRPVLHMPPTPPSPFSSIHPPRRERETDRWPYIRAQRHRAVARDPQHLARDGPRAGQQAAHPMPPSPQPHPRIPRKGGRVASVAPQTRHTTPPAWRGSGAPRRCSGATGATGEAGARWAVGAVSRKSTAMRPGSAGGRSCRDLGKACETLLTYNRRR